VEAVMITVAAAAPALEETLIRTPQPTTSLTPNPSPRERGTMGKTFN